MSKAEYTPCEAPEGKLLLLAGNILTTTLLTAGGVFSCLSAYFLPSHPQLDLGAVLAFCVAASVASAALLTWKHGLWVDLALLAAGGLLLWRGWDKLGEDWLLGRPPWLADLIDEYPAVLFLLCAMAALALALAAVRLRLWYLAAALVTLPVLPAILSGTLPMWGAMLAAFAGWGALLLTSLFGSRDPGSLGRAVLLSQAGMAALLLGLVLALPMEGYTRPQWATDARNSMIRGVSRRMERFFDMEAVDSVLAGWGLDLSVPGEGSGSGPGGREETVAAFGAGSTDREDLLSLGPRRYSGQLMLSLRTDQPGGGRVYLRGGSLGVYTGESWEETGISVYTQPALFPALTAPGGTRYVMSIRDVRYRGVHYYPYRLTGGWGETDEAGRLTLPDEEEWIDGLRLTGAEEYQVGYIPGGPEEGFIPLAGQQGAEERDYLSSEHYLVYQGPESPYKSNEAYDLYSAYLAVPSEAQEVLTPLLEDLEREAVSVDPRLPEDFQPAVTAAARTAALLEALAAYDLDVPAMEEGEDFVAHFLEEGRGYCVHFATAGALLLRMQGIPARYVTGYVAALDGQGRGQARDSDAHAWVEIYLDGYGWYPVEMTPGYAGGETGVDLAGAPEDPGEEASDQPEPGQEPETPDEPEEEAPGGESPDSAETPDEEAEGEAPVLSPVLGRVLAGIGLTLGALGALYGLAVLHRQRERTAGDANRSVIAAYRRYRRLLRRGGEEDALLEELGRKAKFSQHTLTEEEREAAWQSLEKAAAAAGARRPGWQKPLLRLLRPLY